MTFTIAKQYKKGAKTGFIRHKKRNLSRFDNLERRGTAVLHRSTSFQPFFRRSISFFTHFYDFRQKGEKRSSKNGGTGKERKAFFLVSFPFPFFPFPFQAHLWKQLGTLPSCDAHLLPRPTGLICNHTHHWIKRTLAKWIVADCLPYRTVETTPFKAMTRNLDPKCPNFGRKAIISHVGHCPKYYSVLLAFLNMFFPITAVA